MLPIRDDVLASGLECLHWLRNREQGCWGMQNAVPCRVTNTAEAVWAIATLCPTHERLRQDLQPAIDFLKSSLENSSGIRGQSCQHAREFSWVLLALTSVGVDANDPAVAHCINWLLADEHKAESYGWGPSDADGSCRDSTQFTSLAVIAMESFVLAAGKASPAEEKTVNLIRPRIKEGLIGLKALQNPDGGWGEYLGDASKPSFTAYALYALRLAASDLPSSQTLRDGTRYLLSMVLGGQALTTDRDRHASYQHFGLAWSLLALSECLASGDLGVPLDTLFNLADALVEAQNKEDSADKGGWSGLPGGGAASTWGTADALVALNAFAEALDISLLTQAHRQHTSALQELRASLRDRELQAERIQEMGLAWQVTPFIFLAIHHRLFLIILLVFVALSTMCGLIQPPGLPRTVVLFAAPPMAGFMGYSYIRKHLGHDAITTGSFVLALLALVYFFFDRLGLL